MKNIFIVIAALTITTAHSQKLYFGLCAGYSFPIASQNLATNINIGVNQTENRVVKGSYGEGINFSCYLGYHLKKTMSLELDFDALKSKTFSGKYSKDTSFQENSTFTAYMIKTDVLLRFDIPDSRIYFKIGPSFRLASSIVSENTLNDYQSNNETYSKWKYSEGFSVGGFAALGTIRKINKRISYFGEISITVQSWAPKKGNILEYKINGVDGKDALNVNQSTINYSSAFTANNKNFSGWTASQQPKNYQPFNGVALKIGLQFKLGKILQ